ncbi:MAG: amino acid adenylation domain-containing protein, partial [bacterium]|nr:amino acid adenylation domain-containing protein [bacterium]
EKIKLREEYWLNRFAGEIPVLDLPTDYARPLVRSFDGRSLHIPLPVSQMETLKALALPHGITPFMAFLGLLFILLAKLSGQEDIVIGTPVAGRGHADLENIIGMFVNTLALRNHLPGEISFEEFLLEVKEHTLHAFDNQDYPFEDLVEKASVHRDVGRNPLFDVMFLLHAFSPGNEMPSPQENQDSVRYEDAASKFDLTVTVNDTSQTPGLSINYNTSLFKDDTIARFAAYFNTIFSAVTAAPHMELSHIDIISREEKEHILYRFNNAPVTQPNPRTIHQLFSRQAGKTPGNIAVAGHLLDDASHDLTYRELDERARQLAAQIRLRAITPDDIVAIMMEPRPSIIVALLAVLKTGAAYLPIDPLNPPKRIDYMLTDSESKLLLTQTITPSDLDFQGPILDVQAESAYPSTPNLQPLPMEETGDTRAPAYMIYTSGTTGNPKGVLITHENLTNYVEWFSHETQLTPGDKTILTASFAFDLGYTSIYTALLQGAQLHILPKETYMLPRHLLEYIALHRITYLKMTPSLFSALVDDAMFTSTVCSSLRLVVLGGEAVNTTDMEKAFTLCSHLKIMDEYGPTEATIGCIARFIDARQFKTYKTRPDIGKPIHNTMVLILDKYSHLLPVGIAGELCLGGRGLAKGYFKRDALNEEKFITNSFSPGTSHHSHHRIYRTGDRARWLPDGNIEFLGRIDQQIKIRGFRVEPGEIKNRLAKHPAIKDTVLLAQGGDNNKSLCAYFTVADTPEFHNAATFATQLREFLAKDMPDYMIPSFFMQLDKIPLTANGK